MRRQGNVRAKTLLSHSGFLIPGQLNPASVTRNGLTRGTTHTEYTYEGSMRAESNRHSDRRRLINSACITSTSERGNLSLGIYGGITLGSGRAFGGGGYFTVSWTGCGR